MIDPFQLKGPFGADYRVDGDDILRTKKALNNLGHLETPSYGLNEFADMHMIDGLKKFQRDKGLRVDGVMRPEGPTASALGKELAKRDTRPKKGTVEGEWDFQRDMGKDPIADILERLQGRHGNKTPRPVHKPGAFGTAADIGRGRRNTPRDVLAARRALAWAGHLPRDAALDRADAGDDLFTALGAFQKAAGVKTDGWMTPGGETARALDKAIAPKVEAYLKTVGESQQTTEKSGDPDQLTDSDGAPLPSRPGADPKPKTPPNGDQVAFAPAAVAAFDALLPFLIANGGRLGAQRALQALLGGTATAAAGSLKGDTSDEESKPNAPTNVPRTDIADPQPQLPPSDPQGDQEPIKTETPNKPPFTEMDLSNPIPESAEPAIYVHPMPPEELSKWGQIVENKGNETTRKELERIRNFYEGLGWKHVAGGRYSAKNEFLSEHRKKVGDELSERHIPGPGKAWKADSRPGGRFADLTFETPDGRTVHIQSVDVDRNGNTKAHELEAAKSIFHADQGASVYLIPKGAQLKRNKRFQHRK